MPPAAEIVVDRLDLEARRAIETIAAQDQSETKDCRGNSEGSPGTPEVITTP
jgi:hypothetical protein